MFTHYPVRKMLIIIILNLRPIILIDNAGIVALVSEYFNECKIIVLVNIVAIREHNDENYTSFRSEI